MCCQGVFHIFAKLLYTLLEIIFNNGLDETANIVYNNTEKGFENTFVFRNKLLVNARVWLGFGNLLDELKKEKTAFQRVKEFILRQLLKKEMAKKGENA